MNRHPTSTAQTFRATARAYWQPLLRVQSVVDYGVGRLWPNASAAFRKTLFVTLTLVVVFAIALAISPDAHPETFRTPVGEALPIQLPDGTSALLAPETELRVEYVRRVRNLTLVHGEAFFDVKHDPDRPFQVKTNGRIVRDVGTSFSVRNRAGALPEVVVTRGRVDVLDSLNAAVSLAPGNAASLSANQAIFLTDDRPAAVRNLTPADMQRKLAWHSGMLIFNGQPLSSVIAEVNLFSRQRKLIIDEDSSAIGGILVGATLSTVQTQDLVPALLPLGVHSRSVIREGVEEVHLYGEPRAREQRGESSSP